MWEELVKFNKTDKVWHLPIIAGIAIAVPLFLGILFHNVGAGKLASSGALVILYTQGNRLANRMIILMVCGFGLIFSYTIGLVFSFSEWLKPILLALYTFGVYYSLNRIELSRPPSKYFFIMIASVAMAAPHNAADIAGNIGIFSMGVMIACLIALLYSILVLHTNTNDDDMMVVRKNTYANIKESFIFAVMVGISLLVAILLDLKNPYWVPASCVAVMQGATTQHIWVRAIQRVLGTFIGLGLIWLILQMNITVLGICVSILFLQTIVEFLVPRNYGIAVIFISMLTIFLAEANMTLMTNPDQLIVARFFDILTGSVIGAIGGWILYYERQQKSKPNL